MSNLMVYFEYDHLPPGLKETSQEFHKLAKFIDETIPDSPEKTVALRKLLESKDAGVRASLPQKPAHGALPRS